MLVGKKDYQSIWIEESDPSVICVIDQQKLPFSFEVKKIRTVEEMFIAISDLTLRGAPLIGAAGAFGIYLATLEITGHTEVHHHIANAAGYLKSSRPTAVNLSWAIDYVTSKLDLNSTVGKITDAALSAALEVCDLEKENCRQIGMNGLPLIKEIAEKKKGGPVNVLTHCNAGWLACIDYGTATSPVYLAHQAGIPVHVWVDETRPVNQGARLTAWELGQAGVPHTVIADNTGGHLMQHGMVDIVIVGSDRTTRKGDVANKIGTYLKALAAYDNSIPFYVALPSSSIDFRIYDGISEIPVELRNENEVLTITGLCDGEIKTVRLCPEKSAGANYAFDVTPAKYVTGLITEKGICRAEEKEIIKMFSDKIN